MKINFPTYSGIRCLMMPYIQGDETSVPLEYRKGYENILRDVYLEKGKIGYLTIDESEVVKGKAQRTFRSKTSRALHTEVGKHPDKIYAWGGGGSWGSSNRVTLREDTRILLANNIDNTCAIWDAIHRNTSLDGDIGEYSSQYPYKDAIFMKAGDVHEIGILTPHESLPVEDNCKRQFLRIIGDGVCGRESYFTENPMVKIISQ
jgi:hypothetical protein